MESALELKARQLAARNYTVFLIYDGSTEGETGYVLGHPELPGCMGEGETLDEANEDLRDATYGYILLLLEKELNVPMPKSHSPITESDAQTIRQEIGYKENLTVSNQSKATTCYFEFVGIAA